jgi:hypothetical protein
VKKMDGAPCQVFLLASQAINRQTPLPGLLQSLYSVRSPYQSLVKSKSCRFLFTANPHRRSSL